MRYLVTYDIADHRRRDRLATRLLDFGQRLEESVFLVDAADARLEALRERIGKEISLMEDRVHLVPVCEGCWKRAEAFGLAELPGDRRFYVL